MISTGELIRKTRKEKGMNAETLAALCGVSPATIYRYEKGEIENMNSAKILPIAKALGISPFALMGWKTSDDAVDLTLMIIDIADRVGISRSALTNVTNEMDFSADSDEAIIERIEKVAKDIKEKFVPITDAHKIPLLGQIAAGLPLYAEENIEGYIWTDRNNGGDYFGLRVRGNSMNAAGIRDGDIVVVRKQEEVTDQDIAVVLVDDCATIKRLRRSRSTVILTPQSTDPENQAQIYSTKEHEIRVLGKVVESRTEF